MILIIGYIIGGGIYATLMLLHLKKMYRTELKELTYDEWCEKYRDNKENTSFDNWTYYNEYDGPMVMSMFLWPITVFLFVVYVFLDIIYEGVKKILK